MMANSLEDRIQKLDAKKKTLQAKLNRQKRTEDTRKKILLGSFLMEHMKHEKIDAWVKRELPHFLSREQDKKLFSEWLSTDVDLEPKPASNHPDTQRTQTAELADS